MEKDECLSHSVKTKKKPIPVVKNEKHPVMMIHTAD